MQAPNICKWCNSTNPEREKINISEDRVLSKNYCKNCDWRWETVSGAQCPRRSCRSLNVYVTEHSENRGEINVTLSCNECISPPFSI